MKIIIGSESFAPNISGVATAAEMLAKYLSSEGHQVWVFAPSRTFETHEDKSFGDFTVVRLKAIKNPFRKGFMVTYMPAKEINSFVDKIKPDLIHLQDPTSICSALLKSAKKRKIPIVVTNHFSLDYVISYVKFLKPIHRHLRYILRKYLSNFYNSCAHVFCPTETVKKDLLSWGVKTEITAVSNGVDLSRFFSYSDLSDIYSKYHLPANPIVLYMGRVDKDKKIDVFINAIPKILKSVNAHFLVGGMGDELPKMKKLVAKLNIEQEVSWIGWLDRNSEEFSKIYQLATVFAIPSPIETQSIVTMEAMASGLPVVGANAGALPELIENNKNGYLFEPGNSDDLADKVVKILTDEKLRSKMSQYSIEKVSKHELSKSFDQIDKIYKNICLDQ